MCCVIKIDVKYDRGHVLILEFTFVKKRNVFLFMNNMICLFIE